MLKGKGTSVSKKKVFNPKVLWEDDSILVIDKPSGLMVHGDGKNTDPTLSDWILEKYPNIKNVGESLMLSDGKEIIRPGIVHRTDRATSGILLIAKTEKSHAHLKKQFQDRVIKKEYNAFVYGKVREDFGTINAPLGRSKGDFRQYTTPQRARGEMREAITYYEVIKRGQEATHLKLQPKTGRTHQIRAHMVHLGHPIVCDKVYAINRPCILDFKRLALHAHKLTFKDLKGKEVTIESPLPADFKKSIKLLAE